MSKVTIEDISRKTGLSRGTVSRALNNRPDISQQTKQRVLEACRELNYVPSHAARALATGRSFAVTVLLDDLHSMFALRYLRGVIERAQQSRYGVHVVELGPDPQRAMQLVQSLVYERIDGVLAAAMLPPPAAEALRNSLDRRALSLVAPQAGLPGDVFEPDYAEAGRLAGRRVLRGGARRVLYLDDPLVPGAELRRAGFVTACAEHGVPSEHVFLPLPVESAGRSDARAAVANRLSDTDAIVAASDAVALDAMLMCERMGRRPGREIAIVGQGDEPLGALVGPALTTIDLGCEEMGRRGMHTLLQRIDKEREDAPQHTLVPPRLIERATTANLPLAG